MEGIYGFVYSAFHKLDEPFKPGPPFHFAQVCHGRALARWWLQRKWTWAVGYFGPGPWLGLCISVMTTNSTSSGIRYWHALGRSVWGWMMRPGFRISTAWLMTICRWPGGGKIAAAGKGMGVEVCRRPTTHGWDGRGMPQVAERETNPIFTQSNPENKQRIRLKLQ
ncbi:MAG: hypothetical protein CM1200mP29_02790 [Verrucomicrobiota bacterium]|nr:MAG: hypothetical protein CM1200mP29_02790 [Verrucomicrobiota bacterium]